MIFAVNGQKVFRHSMAKIFFRYPAVFLTGLVIVTSLFLAARLSLAELEVPLINQTSFTQTDFRSIWGFYRSHQFNDSGSMARNYETWAVGTVTSGPLVGRGGLYRWQGQKWEQVVPHPADVPETSLTLPAFTAVGGQFQSGSGYADPMWVAGYSTIAGDPDINQPKIFSTWGNSNVDALFYPAPSTLGSKLADKQAVSQLCAAGSPCPTANCNANICVGGLNDSLACTSNAQCPASTSFAGRPIYTIGAAQKYQGRVLAGGKDGLLLNHVAYYGNQSQHDQFEDITSVFTSSGLATASDDVVGIQFLNNDIAYVATTNFGDVPGQTHPYDHGCAGTETGKVFRVLGDPKQVGSWKLIASKINTCFYGLSAVSLNTMSASAGPLVNRIWLASSGGVERLDDDDYRSAAGLRPITRDYTSGASKLFGIAAVADRGGDAQNLLANGGFNAQLMLNPTGGIPANTINPDSWVISGENGVNDVRLVVDVTADTAGAPAGSPDAALMIEPSTEASLVTASGRVPGSAVEGKRYHITGRFKVEMLTSALDVVGGVQLGCTGAVPPGGVDCSMASVQYLRKTDTVVQTTCDQNGGLGGFACIDITVSREDSQLNRYIKGLASAPKNTGQGLTLEVRCLGTYGTRVTCDDLRVEEVNTPAIAARDTVQVTAVGQGLAVTSTNATAATPSYTVEDNSSTSDFSAIMAVDAAHVYAVGNNSAMYQRSAGSINGYIYAGTTSPGNSGGPLATNGWISTNCSNSPNRSSPADFSQCQKSSTVYGLSLDNNRITGRAWFGKNFGDEITSEESINLGQCVGAALRADKCNIDADNNGTPDHCSLNPSIACTVAMEATDCTIAGNTPYYIGGDACIDGSDADLLPDRCGANPIQTCTTATEANDQYSQCGRSCNPVSRTCYANPGKVCFRDFDCYGRCAADAGFLCLADKDCQVGGPPTTSETLSGTQLNNYPYFRVQCTGSNPSPLACTSPGWLTFNPAEFIGSVPASIEPGVCVGGARTGLACGAPVNCPGGSCNTTQRNYCVNGGMCLNTTTNGFSGVAQFLNLANPNDPNVAINPAVAGSSWVSFRGAISNLVAEPISSAGLYGCKSCTISVAGGQMSCKFCQDDKNRSCVPPTPPAISADFPYTCQLYCGGDRSRPKCRDTNDCVVAGDAGSCRSVGYCSVKNGAGNLVACTSDANCSGVDPDASCIFGADCNPAGASCQDYGVNFDALSSNKFSGYAWNPTYGWLQMANVRKGASRFLQTKLGDIYATGQIGSSDVNTCDVGLNNATYLIASNSSIINFCSALTSVDVTVLQRGAPQIPFASPANTYANVLGRFDVAGMEQPARVVTGPPTRTYNKFGSEISALAVPGDVITGWTSPVSLDGKVYTVGAIGSLGTTYDLNPPLAFANYCDTTLTSGAGLLIVHGNLRINGNLTYQNCLGGSAPQDLRQLASLVVVVTGDLTIDNTVTSLVGTYYVGGTIKTSSAIDSGSNKYPLTIRGLMIAKRFIFGRKFAGTSDNPLPSELIIFDGRLQSNPLPGMVDFASALPNTVNTGP